ncbi:hypothetical protein B0H14DRAFT_3167665 [Mycena olivaceomarginata]|nr:hypothetical protein B0H14DRAFT_3167665 [Mycena olivaceomarginata]
MCGGLHRTSIPVYMLVAARVKEWLEPILYRVLFCSDSSIGDQHVEISGLRIIPLKTLLPLIGEKPPNFFQKAVRHLFLVDGDDSDVDSILKACNHLTDLFAYFDPTPYACTLSALQHLRRLAIALPPFLERFPLNEDMPSVFGRLTHLELMDTHLNLNVRDLSKRLPLMPNLTHLALNLFLHDTTLYDTLRLQTTLECIVILVQTPVEMTNTHPLAGDTRFVCIHQSKSYRLDWLCGALTGNDYWALADAFIAARRARKVDASRYIISNEAEPWMA